VTATIAARAAQRWFHGLGRTGFAIVTSVALVTTLNTTAKYLVTEPVGEWLAAFVENFAFHLGIGVAMLLAAVAARNRFPVAGATQYVAVFAATMVAALIVLTFVASFDVEDDWFHVLIAIGADGVRFTFVGIVIASTWLYLRTEAEHVDALARCAVDAARMDEQTAEARLQLLEAQIEPHFLFNTLANVRRLYEVDRPNGARMLANLKAYLANALPQMRMADSTLGREVDHAAAYLRIQQIRMGRRLDFVIDVPATLRDARMPSLMLVTLVENAVKHALSPLPEGGRIAIRATLADARLHLSVTDNGQGFTKSSGGGTGLANIRARLATQFGAAARFSLALNAPTGVIATVELPCQRVETPSPS
jgi:signal transduction histidine kinase